MKNNYYILDPIYNNKFAIKIQSLYRGYKQRKLLKNIYIKLPDDLQYKIIDIIREDYYYNKYINTLKTIISNKLFKYINLYMDKWWEDYLLFIEYIIDNENYIKNTCLIYKKYYSLLDNNKYIDVIKEMNMTLDILLIARIKYNDYITSENYHKNYNIINNIYYFIKDSIKSNAV